MVKKERKNIKNEKNEYKIDKNKIRYGSTFLKKE